MDTFERGGKSNIVKIVLPLAVAALLVITILGVYLSRQNKAENSKHQQTSQQSAGADATTGQSTQSGGAYKDGEYTETGIYRSPDGMEQIEVTVTLEDGVVTDATVVSMAENPNSKTYQSRFIRAFKPFVVGKNINDIELDTVGGSSLTPDGFEAAFEKIKSDASA